MAKNTVKFVENKQYNSTEVYFAEKPSPSVLTALKTVKFRWNRVKGCWYGFCTPDELKTIITKPSTAQSLAEKKQAERVAFHKAERDAKKAESETKTNAKAEIKAKEDAKARDKKALETVKTGTEVYKTTKPATKPKKAPKKVKEELNFDDVKKASKDDAKRKASKSKK